MAELSLMAVPTFPSGPFHQEQSISMASKDFQTFLPSPRMGKEFSSSGSSHQLRPRELEDPWKCMAQVTNSSIKRPVLIDVQESQPDSILFSFGIAEQCRRLQCILRFLMSGSSEAGREGIDFSLLSDLVGLDTLKFYMHMQTNPFQDRFSLYELVHDDYQRSLIYTRTELCSKTPLVDFIGDLASSLKTTAQPDGRVAFSGTRPQMKDLLSIVEEFYPSKNSAKLINHSLLLPQSTRTETSEARANIQGSSSKLQTVTVTPLKSPKKIKLNPLPKKRNSRNVGKERDLYRRSYLHACESLLSLILDKRHGNTTLLSLKNFDPELPQLLTQFSAGIAGTGLAVLLSVVCKVSGGRVPFSASKLLNTGFGIGLVWLSWAVNKLRDTIIYISKNTNKVGVKDKEMIRRVDKSVNEMFFRAATVMMFAMLRFA